METLPNEMLELIVRQLKPQDLAHCSAVSRSWYEMMNQDWIWEPYCDPELEEPLRTIPSVATPKFEIPESKTLSPISRWKLAFLRERHLWKNWKSDKLMGVKNSIWEPALLKVDHLRKKWGPEKTVLNFGNKNPFSIDFFSDTLIVVWYNDMIEILDVSITPAVIVAKTDTLVEIEQYYQLSVVETDLLLVGKKSSLEIYKVDIPNGSITLKLNLDDISLYTQHKGQNKKNLYIFTSYKRENLKILDLNNGTILKEEPCPIKANEKEETSVTSVFSSPTSDFVAVTVKWSHNVIHGDSKISLSHTKAFVYCLKEFKFLSGPDISAQEDIAISLHEKWFAVFCGMVTIFNVESGEVLFSDELSLDFHFTMKMDVCNGWFVFMDCTDQIMYRSGSFSGPPKSHVRVYSPASKTLTTIKRDFEKDASFLVINNKFVIVVCEKWKLSDSVWKPSSQTSERAEPLIEEWDLSIVRSWKINSSFTKEISQYKHTWYINHVW